jgi:hypothetical protein
MKYCKAISKSCHQNLTNSEYFNLKVKDLKWHLEHFWKVQGNLCLTFDQNA